MRPALFTAEAQADEAFDVADLQPQVQPQAAKGPDWGSFGHGLSN